MSGHFDALEARDPARRDAEQLSALRTLVAHAQAHSPAWAERLRGVEPASLTSRAALAQLPVLRKHELLEQQAARRSGDVFGGFAAVGWGTARPPAGRAARVFASPGPIFEPDTMRADYWRMGRALHAAGVRAGHLVHNAFSYHFTPAGAMMESAAQALGCTVFPAGTGQTEQQVQMIAALQPDAYAGTPSFLRLLVDKADELGLAWPATMNAVVSGEAFPDAVRLALGKRGIEAYQTYGTADLGLIAYETSAREGWVVDEGVILEIVGVGTNEPAEDGEIGEVVVTALNPDYPLIRFGTGDLSAVLPGHCPTGRTNTRIRGWLGRADQSAKVRGLFIHPSQVVEIARRHAEVRRARLVISGDPAGDRMTLEVEADASAAGDLAARLAATIREVTRLRGDVDVHAPGTLPVDGKVIDDRRAAI